MTQPTPAWNLVRVTGSYTTLDGQSVTGSVVFSYKTIGKDHAAKKIVLPATFTAPLVSGAFTIVLPATDDPDIDGTPFVVTITPNLTVNGTKVNVPAFDAELSLSWPASGSPSYPTMDLGDVGKATPAPLVVTYVTRPELNAAIAAAGGGGGGAVDSVDGRTGTVVLSDRYDALGAAASAQSAAATDATTKANTAVTTAASGAAGLYVPLTQRAAASGVATLDGGGKVPTGQIPALSYDAAGAAATAQTAAVAAAASAAAAAYVPLSQKGANSGVATLDSGGHVPAAQLASAPVLVLATGDPVPGGTPAGTVIVRH